MSFTFIHQKDAMQCGAACLAMICSHRGVKFPLDYIDSICIPSKEGVSMLAISEAAKALGLNNTTIKLATQNLSKTPLPAILHWDQSHFVVLYKITRNGNRFHVADPGKGKIAYSLKDFNSHWVVADKFGIENKGIAMFFNSDVNFKNEHSIQDNRPISVKFLYKYLKRYLKHLAIVVCGLILGCLLQLIMPFLTQLIVDKGIKNSDMSLIWLIMLGELAIVSGRTAIDFIRRWLLLHISMRINISLVSDFFIKLLKLPMSFFDMKLTGDLLQRMGDHSRVQMFLTNQVLNVLFSLLSFVVLGVVLCVYNTILFSIFFLGSIIYVLWISAFLYRRRILDYELFELQSINQGKTYQFITSMQEIKLQGCELRRRWEWEDIQADLFKIQLKSLKLQQMQEAGSIFINELKNIFILIIAATLVIDGQITLGTMLAIQYIVGQLNSPIEQLMGFIYSLQDVKISLERINEIQERGNEDSKENQISDFKSSKVIKLNMVNFKYDPHALKKTLDNVSFDVPEGKVTAIVGASGSGKTTLIKLMLGYYPALSGAITISGHDINEYNLKWWRRQCGVVMQDGVIFSESIARNIAVGDEEIDPEQLKYAARLANIHDYIMSLPLKYNTIIGCDGIGLSQGQKQRILIARAVYKNPDFIFFDEATNALDAKNEHAIVESLNEFYRGRTVVVVAHRLSTVRSADQIIVLDEGRVVEIGNHTSLIKTKGSYYHLVKNQLELGN